MQWIELKVGQAHKHAIQQQTLASILTDKHTNQQARQPASTITRKQVKTAYQETEAMDGGWNGRLSS